MKKILLSNIHKYFIVDDEDELRCLNHPWYLSGKNNSGIKTNINSEVISIGRYLLNYSGPLDVDHKDRNIFNNQKSNLRVATRSQNTANKGILDSNTSGYKGVSSYKYKGVQKWQAYIHFNNSKIHLGIFSDIKIAAKAYNRAALEYFGEFACLNSILEGGE